VDAFPSFLKFHTKTSIPYFAAYGSTCFCQIDERTPGILASAAKNKKSVLSLPNGSDGKNGFLLVF
jgi:hypothetical protein